MLGLRALFFLLLLAFVVGSDERIPCEQVLEVSNPLEISCRLRRLCARGCGCSFRYAEAKPEWRADDSLQQAVGAGMASLMGHPTESGADGLADAKSEKDPGLEVQFVQTSTPGDAIATWSDDYVGERVLHNLTLGITGRCEASRFFDMEISYTTVQEPARFVTLYSAKSAGPTLLSGSEDAVITLNFFNQIEGLKALRIMSRPQESGLVGNVVELDVSLGGMRTELPTVSTVASVESPQLLPSGMTALQASGAVAACLAVVCFAVLCLRRRATRSLRSRSKEVIMKRMSRAFSKLHRRPRPWEPQAEDEQHSLMRDRQLAGGSSHHLEGDFDAEDELILGLRAEDD